MPESLANKNLCRVKIKINASNDEKHLFSCFTDFSFGPDLSLRIAVVVAGYHRRIGWLVYQ
jgi:hypothetical protein